jgi:hypothetical protein
MELVDRLLAILAGPAPRYATKQLMADGHLRMRTSRLELRTVRRVYRLQRLGSDQLTGPGRLGRQIRRAIGEGWQLRHPSLFNRRLLGTPRLPRLVREALPAVASARRFHGSGPCLPRVGAVLPSVGLPGSARSKAAVVFMLGRAVRAPLRPVATSIRKGNRIQ